ncbi:MAG: DNA repair protein RadC [Rickettsiales bacterium]
MKSLLLPQKTSTAPHTTLSKGSSTNINAGRRSRVRERLLNAKLGSLYDYEILEMFLYLSIPRRDVKPLAKKLLHDFKTLACIVNTTPGELAKITGIGSNTVANLKLLREIIHRINKEEIYKTNAINNRESLIKFLRSSVGFQTNENIHILYLNSKNHLIDDEIIDYGTANKITLYPREVVKKALDTNATAVIICHNHPSGDTTPSRADILMTKNLESALQAVDVILHDHVIISPSNYFSFRNKKLI